MRSRRRIDDEGEEEEEGSVIAGAEDDSLSEASMLSDADDDADAEGSDGSETGPPERRDAKPKAASSIRSPAASKRKQANATSPTKPSLNNLMADTEMMMNGLRFSGDVDEEGEINFEDMAHEAKAAPEHISPSEDPSSAVPATTLGEKRRREHEEYKKKRDADPAFVPNRGGFFMHDHRSAQGQNGFKPYGRGRGRGRGDMPGPPQSVG